MTFQEFAQKKVAGIPVLYLIGGAVIILAIVAWKMPGSKPEEEVPADAADVGQETADPYDEFETQGTVIVKQVQPDPELSNQGITTNQEWLVKGTAFLIKEVNATGTLASSALQKYLNGQDRSYQEEEYVNRVIREYGLPPDGADQGGTASPRPVAKQFQSFPGVHTIAGGTDNSYSAIAALYYGNTSDDRIDLLEAANTSIGKGPWAEGTKVNVPAYRAPKIYITSVNTTKKRETAAQVAAKHGISLTQLGVLNDPAGGVYKPDYLFSPGARIRVA